MLVGTWLTWHFGRTRGARWAFAAQAGTLAAFFLVANAVVPLVVHRDTTALAEIVCRQIKPGDRRAMDGNLAALQRGILV